MVATNGTHASTNGALQSERLWSPPVDDRERNMDRFRQFVNDRYKLDLQDYHDLYSWSVSKIADFWESVWIWSKIKCSRSYDKVSYQWFCWLRLQSQRDPTVIKVLEDVPMQKIPKWFMGARLNFAENLLPFDDNHVAIIATGEYGRTEKLTYSELRERVRVFAGALRASGVGVGDRVCAYIPNCIEAVVGMLATTSLGAIWSSTSPDFGVVGVLERFSQVKPKILLTVNAIVYNSKVYDHIEKVKHVADGLTEVSRVVVIPFVQSVSKSNDLSGVKGGIWLENFLGSSDDAPLRFEQLPPDQPVYIMYSSGTTGLPKCMVHSALGTLLKHKTEQTIHSSLDRKDVLFYYTTTGWMMWNWLVSGLATGLTIFLYDGSPFKPTATRLIDLIDEHSITVFGTSAKFLQSLQETSVRPRESHKLTSLHTILSTGSPLQPESYDYVYRDVKPNVLLGSISGGTDIVSCFVGQNDTLPVHKGEIQCRLLGMAIEAWDVNGKPVIDEDGDMVCVKPFPSMPVAFWNDTADRTKYMAAYFEQYTGVWYHGDYLRINSKTGGVVLLGRSDGTLNPGGVRFGSAEIYHIMTRFQSEITDTLCVGQKIGVDERVVLFCQMAPGHQLTEDVRKRIAKSIRDELSPRHVPAIILPIADIPHTINGKKVEVAVKKIINGAKVVPSGTLANPESLELLLVMKLFAKWAQLRRCGLRPLDDEVISTFMVISMSNTKEGSQSYNGNATKAELALRETIAWRVSNWDKLLAARKEGQARDDSGRISRRVPFSPHKTLLDGSPVWIVRQGLMDMISLMKVATREEIEEWFLMGYESVFVQCDHLSRVTGRITKLTILVDNSHSSPNRFDAAYTQALASANQRAKIYYPQLIGMVVVVNSPVFSDALIPLLDLSLTGWEGSETKICPGNATRAESSRAIFACPIATRVMSTSDIPTFLGGECTCDGKGCVPPLLNAQVPGTDQPAEFQSAAAPASDTSAESQITGPSADVQTESVGGVDCAVDPAVKEPRRELSKLRGGNEDAIIVKTEFAADAAPVDINHVFNNVHGHINMQRESREQ
ncbi:hypothetical protein HDU93_004343 [Gonapodya sp. JEL0774]|nr:hypothetical protein HDU93_004343 [Gonapodya sp. JEL0774]